MERVEKLNMKSFFHQGWIASRGKCAVARAGFAGRRRKSVPELLNSSGTGCANSTSAYRSSVEREQGSSAGLMM